ncbi:MAG: ribbon-helix-helix domain-containing protein [Candidatus Caldarchaeum sp.]
MTIYMSSDVVEQVDIIAAREGLNRSELISRIVVEWLAKYRSAERPREGSGSGDWLVRKIRDLDGRDWVPL